MFKVDLSSSIMKKRLGKVDDYCLLDKFNIFFILVTVFSMFSDATYIVKKDEYKFIWQRVFQ